MPPKRKGPKGGPRGPSKKLHVRSAEVAPTETCAASAFLTSSVSAKDSRGTKSPAPGASLIRRRTSRMVLVPVAALGSDIYTLSCITDVLSRFGAQVVVARVECCPSDVSSANDNDTTGGAQCSSHHGDNTFTSSSRTGHARSPPRQLSSPKRGGRNQRSTISQKDLICKTSSGVVIVADTTIRAAAEKSWDVIVIPGGILGCKHLRSCEVLMNLLKHQRSALKLLGAIGEAPAIVLASASLLCLSNEGKGATCIADPLLRLEMPEPVDQEIVLQGNLITGAGPNAAIKFALKIGEQIYGSKTANRLASELLEVDRCVENDSIPTQAKRLYPKKRKRSSGDSLIGKDKNSGLDKDDCFTKIVWSVLDSLGWTIEKKLSAGLVYCPPGVHRDADGYAMLQSELCDGKQDINIDARDDIISCFETNSEVIDYILQNMSSSAPAQDAAQLYTHCLERVDDIVEMGRLSRSTMTLDSLLEEIEMNARIDETPLFDEIIWPTLMQLGWTIEEESRTHPRSYVEPRNNAGRFDEEFAATKRKQIMDHLLANDVWGSNERILKVLEVYWACICVGNKLGSEGLLIDDWTPLWLYMKAKEIRPSLSYLEILLGPEDKMPPSGEVTGEGKWRRENTDINTTNEVNISADVETAVDVSSAAPSSVKGQETPRENKMVDFPLINAKADPVKIKEEVEDEAAMTVETSLTIGVVASCDIQEEDLKGPAVEEKKICDHDVYLIEKPSSCNTIGGVDVLVTTSSSQGENLEEVNDEMEVESEIIVSI